MVTKESYNKRKEAMRTERSSFILSWRELSDNILANRGRFLVTDRNKGHKRNTNQITSKPRVAVRTMASGMMAGITSPARPWFRLATSDPLLNDNPAVKEWLHDAEVMMREVFSQSNLYSSLHKIYAELGVFGTGCMGVFEDFDNVVRFKPYTVGSYMLAMNGKDVVDVMYREYQLTVGQLVDEFGIENVSPSTAQLYEKGNTEAWITVTHIVEPNNDRDGANPLSAHKKFRSVYYEDQSSKAQDDKFLRVSGFEEFPILAPRWDVVGEDIYGTDCPGMIAIGDTKALQLGERRMSQAVDKVANPPTQAPSSLRNKVSAILPGEVLFVDDTTAGGIRSIYDYKPDLGALEARNIRVEDRVDEAFFVDLFLMLSNSDRRQITATEISERHEEKLLMLGPVLENLHNELLDPLIDRTFAIMQRKGILPPPPEELQDTELKVEYISILAQAQRLVEASNIERSAGFAGELAQVWPEVRHKFNALEAVDSYNDAIGISPKIIRGNDEVAKIMAQEQQAAQAQQSMDMAQQGMDVAKAAGEIDTEGNNLVAATMQRAGIVQ